MTQAINTRLRLTGIVSSLAALAFSLALSHDAGAQYRDRNRAPQVAPEDTEPEINRKRPPRGDRPDVRKERLDKRAPRSRARPEDQPRRAAPEDKRRRQAQPKGQRPDRNRGRRAEPQRRTYDRQAERRWHKDRPGTKRDIYVPRRWTRGDRPHHRNLWKRRYGRVWWCGTRCRIGLLFGFSVWTIHTVVAHDSPHGFPVWEALEYNRTGETSLWESGWGYVEFTPTRTFTTRFGSRVRDCRDFLRVVVRNDGLERRYRGTACRNPRGAWWIVS